MGSVATGCEFIYDSNGDGIMNEEALLNLPTLGNEAESHVIIDCNLKELNFTIRAVFGTTLSSERVPLDCPVTDSMFDPVSSGGKQGKCLHFIPSLFKH